MAAPLLPESRAIRLSVTDALRQDVKGARWPRLASTASSRIWYRSGRRRLASGWLWDRSQVISMVLRHGLSLAAVGIVVGLIGAFALTRLMQSLLYEVRPNDPITFVAVAAVLLFIALMASFLPARRATRVSPTIALRAQ